MKFWLKPLDFLPGAAKTFYSIAPDFKSQIIYYLSSVRFSVREGRWTDAESYPTRSLQKLFSKNGAKEKLFWYLLKIFAGISYVVALILLICAGFNGMYLNNDTFGESPCGDYFILLTWGFGSEACQEAIANIIGG